MRQTRLGTLIKQRSDNYPKNPAVWTHYLGPQALQPWRELQGATRQFRTAGETVFSTSLDSNLGCSLKTFSLGENA